MTSRPSDPDLPPSATSPTIPITGETRPSTPPAPPDPARAPAGSRFGKFIRTEILGSGGMGEVWKAWDVDLNRWVALKFLKATDSIEVLRFKREAQLAGKLTHPNIAAIYEVGEMAGQHFIAMQFIDGVGLREFPRRDLRAIAALVRDAAAAVHYAHEQGIIHRDIKPDNFMITRPPKSEPHLYVMDFGLARASDGGSDLSQSGVIYGTPSFMSPEQARGEQVGPASDIFSLGSSLYEGLTGSRGFVASNILDTLRKVLDEEPVRPRKRNPRIDSDLETIVLKCLEKDRRNRYGTAQELADDLDRWLRGEMIRAVPASLFYRLRKIVARRKGWLIAASAAILAATITLAVLTPRWRAERERNERASADRIAADREREIMSDLNRLWKLVVDAKEMTRQGYRKPADVRLEMESVIVEVTRFVEQHPKKPHGWYVRGRARHHLADLDGAERDLARSVELDPAFAPGWALMGLVLTDKARRLDVTTDAIDFHPTKERDGIAAQAGDCMRKSGQAGGLAASASREGISWTTEDEVAANTLEVLAVHSTAPRAAVTRLIEYQARKPSDEYCRTLAFWAESRSERLKWLTEAITIAPHQGLAYVMRAKLCLAMNDAENALLDSDLAIAFSPLEIQAHLNRTLALARLGRMKEALLECDRIIEIDPTFAMGWVCRANTHNKMGDSARAMEDIGQALALDGANPMTWTCRASYRLDRGDLAGAIEDCTTALGFDPNCGQAFSKRGRAHLQRGDFERALKDLDRAVEFLPRECDAWFARASTLVRLNKLDAAAEDFEQALRIAPNRFDIYINRGYMESRRNNLAAAKQNFEKAIELNPHYAMTYHNLGSTMESLGDLREALRQYTLACEKDPKDPNYLLDRGRVSLLLGNRDEGIRDIRKCLELAPASWPHRTEALNLLGVPDQR